MSQACNSHAHARQVGVGGAAIGIVDQGAEVCVCERETDRQNQRERRGGIGRIGTSFAFVTCRVGELEA